MIPLREMVSFISDIPMCPLRIGREKSKNALRNAGVTESAGLVFLCTKKNPEVENPTVNDLFEVGMIASAAVSAKSLADIRSGAATFNILHGGIYPARLLSLHEVDDVQFARIEPFSPWYPEVSVGQHWKQMSELMEFAKTTDLAQSELVRLWGEDQKSCQLMNFCYSLLGSFAYTYQQELLASETPEGAIEICFSKLRQS